MIELVHLNTKRGRRQILLDGYRYGQNHSQTYLYLFFLFLFPFINPTVMKDCLNPGSLSSSHFLQLYLITQSVFTMLYLFRISTGKKNRQITRRVKNLPIRGDDNCLFRSLSVWLTGTESQLLAVRGILTGNSEDPNPMKQLGVWGGTNEIFEFAKVGGIRWIYFYLSIGNVMIQCLFFLIFKAHVMLWAAFGHRVSWARHPCPAACPPPPLWFTYDMHQKTISIFRCLKK